MKILVAGDFCPQNRVAKLFNQDNYNAVLGEVKNVLNKGDYSIVNFECPVTKGSEKPIFKQGPNLQCSENGFAAIKWVGFNCVTLANNHILDYGEEGLENTLEKCESIGIDKVGGGRNLSEASAVLYKEIQGKTLAVINCCEHEFSIATENTAGANPLNPIQQFYAIKEAKANADYVLVIVHGGFEHYQLPSPRMQETYRFFIDAGADVVVNHHQHCFSGYEVWKGKPIFYGLGNFCFDRNDKINCFWNEGIMVLITFKEEIEFKFIPYTQCNETAKVSLLEESTFDNRIKELNLIIEDKNCLTKTTQEYLESFKVKCSSIFEPSSNRLYLALLRRGWLPSFITLKRKTKAANMVCCESHREKLVYYLEH